MTLKTALKQRAAAQQRYLDAAAQVDEAIRLEREAGKTIPELIKTTGLSYRGVYLALGRANQHNERKT